ncbi:hypothetical protein KU306_16570 (plasmid) [Haloferax larsenii]|uniref:Uncharacterized protein n=1 Tax=Haloferax larsenii TaxID=302484 RepID=A0ABY5RHT1_HALLR|nr:hypothetical protein [Haloferax larsenii]UVE51941.1 hypothetical protein KU306_16570 [Haloferax larsenii]
MNHRFIDAPGLRLGVGQTVVTGFFGPDGAPNLIYATANEQTIEYYGTSYAIMENSELTGRTLNIRVKG